MGAIACLRQSWKGQENCQKKEEIGHARLGLLLLERRKLPYLHTHFVHMSLLILCKKVSLSAARLLQGVQAGLGVDRLAFEGVSESLGQSPAVGERFGDMLAANLILVLEVGEGSGDLNHAVKAARGKLQLFSCRVDQTSAICI